jgi:ketosteroid isomerase-like protein
MSLGVNASEFSRAWAAAWNRRDVEAVLAHFHDDAVFASPVAQRLGFGEDGVVKGKEALRRYWNGALLGNPDLHFRVHAVYEGVDTLVIAYRTQSDADRVEVLLFQDGLVVQGRGTFGVA